MNIDNLKGFIIVEGIDGSGKSTLVTRLHNLLIANDKSVYSFSISDLCKTGHVDKQVEIKYEDIINFNSAREKVNSVLQDMKNLEVTDSQYVMYCNKLMKNYFSAMRVYSKIVKTYLDNNFVVIADRWFLSSLAYNNIVSGTDFNVIYNLNKNLILDPEDKEYNKLLLDLRTNFTNVIEPDITIYIDVRTEVSIERISKREKCIDGIFETKNKLDNVRDAYNYILNTFKLNNEKTLFNLNNILWLNGELNTNTIIMNLIEKLK